MPETLPASVALKLGAYIRRFEEVAGQLAAGQHIPAHDVHILDREAHDYLVSEAPWALVAYLQDHNLSPQFAEQGRPGDWQAMLRLCQDRAAKLREVLGGGSGEASAPAAELPALEAQAPAPEIGLKELPAPAEGGAA